DVNTAIDKRVEKGCLIMNYTGHGGEVGLAHERVVEVSQINSWKNINNMPLFFTATCELSRWDDPARTSGGEYMFLNPNGGGIALFTTTRESYSAPNFTLNDSFYQFIFKTFNGRMPRLGDAWQYIKDLPVGTETNGRNFTMLGDPALTLAYPKLDVSTDTINNVLVTSTSSDTLRALTRVTVSGYVRNKNGTILNTYNGVLYPTVYDKPQNITTLSNDGAAASPARTFKLQKNVLYKGKVSVNNGHFKFTFIVPKDINYQYGIGRISYYAENGSVDANGYCEKVIIGGSSTTAPSDLVGPELKLYMNDNKFVYGGTTNESPDLYAILKDENGINTVGNGIGHDITAVLDANTNSSIVLNDYYQADLNSYKSGSVRYPFSTLPDGKHTLKLKAWDVYDNSSDAYTEFVVAKSAEFALTHVLNYPNPFTTKTQFFFEENQCCQNLEVQIQIYTVTGKIIKTLNENMSVEGFRSSAIDWDGRDEFGDKIGRGVYIYKVKVRSAEGLVAEQFEKLVLLR
ncbi:MAG: type IX secretion system sortase PorU, partial [Bacteroidota bacterium]